MICYRDMSFCDESSTCANTDCRRNFTEHQKTLARKWWGGENAPIAFMQLRDSALCAGYKPK